MKNWTPFLLGASALIIILYLGKKLDQGNQPR